MRKIYFLLLTIVWAATSSAQSTVNYNFATATNGSLTDMSSGTTQLIAANQDDAASAVTNIGFDIFFQGTRYGQFSVNSNGSMRLGGTTISTTLYDPLAQAGISIITAYGADQRTHTTGKVHFKVTGAAPNRMLIIEWLNMQADFNSGGTVDLTYQVRITETTGVIEFAYGSIAMSANGSADVNSNTPQIGFSSNNVANTVGSVTAAQSGTPAPTYNGASATAATNTYTTGTIPALTSAANGSRRIFTFTPVTPTAAPTGLNFTAVTPLAMTLNWTDVATNEIGYAIYRSDDGGVTYNYISQTAANATSSVQASLLPSTNYFWRVYAVTEGALSTSLQGSQATAAPGIVTSITSGLWSQTTTWSTGVIPAATDNVTIADGTTVTIDIAAVALNLNVGQGVSGVLQYEQTTARTLTVSNNVTIANNGTFQSNPAGTVTTHVLSLGGNITNNGALRFSTNANTAGAGITFTGASNNTFGGTGATTDIRTLTINKGTSNANILELLPSNFSVQGTVVDGTPMAFLTLTNGTLKVSGSFTVTGRIFTAAGYSIGATTGFWLNNPNFSVSGQNGSPTVAGLLRITQGTLNIGTATGNSMGFSTGSTIIVEGGAVNAAGRFGVAAAANTFNYTQSAGTITVCTVGNTSTTLASFDLGTSTASTIAVSGGTIVCQLAASGFDYRMQAGSGLTSVTGGTLQLGNAASGAAKAFIFRGLLPLNTVITNTSGNHSLTLPATAPTSYVYAVQNLTINTGNTFTNLQTGTNPEFFVGNVINDGTFTSTTAGNRVYNTTGAIGATTWSGAGVFTPGITSFEVDNAAGVTLNTVNQIPTNRIILFTGAFTNSNKFTIGNGGTTTGIIQIGNTTTPTDAGIFDAAPTFNLGTGGEVISYLRTINTRVTGPEINPARTVAAITYDDNDPSHTLVVAGGDITVTGLTLTTGRVVTAANTVIIPGAGTVTRTAGYVDGNLRKNYTAAASKTFETGTANGYSPVAVNVTAGTFPTDITAKAVQGTQPSLSAANSLQRYWTVTGSGITTDFTFNYLAGDVSGTEANYKVVRVSGGVVTGFPASTVNTGTHVANITGVAVSSSSDWSLSEICTGATGGTATGGTAFCNVGTPTITASGYSTGTTTVYQWQSSTDNFVSNIVDIIAQNNPAALTTGAVSATTYYRLKVTCTSGGAIDYSNIVTVTINPLPFVFSVTGGGSYCSGSTGVHIGLSGSTVGVNYQLNNTGGPVGAPVPGNGSTIDFGVFTAADTYTVVAINPTTTCTINMTGSATITVNPVPVITPTKTEPTTCTTTDGAITLAISGSTGPYTFAWTGTGVNATSQNQTGLTAGSYSVTVTANATLCSTTLNITLVGPGGCNICPTMPTLATTPATQACSASPVTITASGLTNMGVTYGIIFKDYAAATANPYTGGTVIATVANGSLTASGTTAATTTSSLTAGNHFIYAILTPTPLDPSCRPSNLVNITINQAPAATISYAGSPYCQNAGTATVTFTGTTGGTYTSTTGLTINSATGAVTTTTSTPGTYTVTYTVAASGGCSIYTTTASITITATPSATISYAGTPYCQNTGTASVTRTGTAGGTYTSTTGLTINASTGAVTTTSSTPGTYTVTYTVAAAGGCAVFTTTASITITATPSATISYAGSPYCQNAGTANVNATGTTGGTYTSTAGLTINATTGAVTTTTSTPGTYTVTYTVAAAGGCAVFTTTASITITATPSATISYAGTPYCLNAGTANVTQTGTTGGTYTSTTGLTINASTGAVTTTTSTAGTYTVTYTVAAAGGCSVFTTTATITITALPTATISYAGSPYCQNAGTATVTRTGTAGGAYTSTTGLTIDAVTGTVTLGTSTPGTYTVTYTVAAAGGCAVFSTTTSITVSTVSVAPTGATTSIAASCGPTTTTLAVVGGTLGAGASWKWYSASCGGTLVGTGATLTGVAVNSTTTYYVRAEGSCNTTTCASVTVTINPIPVITLSAAPYTSLRPPLTTTITANITPSGNNTIVWYRDGNVVTGATTNVLSNLTVDQLGTYTVGVTTPAGCSAVSAPIVIKDSASDRLFITPNPNNGQFKIRYYTNYHSFGFMRIVTIYDNKGEKVFSKPIPITAPYSAMDIDIRKASHGLYIVVVSDYNGVPLAQGKVSIQ